MQKLNKKRHFMIISNDGTTFDNAENLVENCQVLDFIEATNLDEAQNNFDIKKYGNFQDYKIIEYLK